LEGPTAVNATGPGSIPGKASGIAIVVRSGFSFFFFSKRINCQIKHEKRLYHLLIQRKKKRSFFIPD